MLLNKQRIDGFWGGVSGFSRIFAARLLIFGYSFEARLTPVGAMIEKYIVPIEMAT
ncbi:hypothetical protein [Cupriavidus necator]